MNLRSHRPALGRAALLSAGLALAGGALAADPAKPKIAVLEYTWDVGPGQQSTLARYGLALIDKGRLRGPYGYNSFASAVKAKNPAIRLAQYTINGEVRCELKPGDQWAALVQGANDGNWWLRRIDGQRTQWTKNYSACDTNPTEWAGRNAQGQTYMQWKWQADRKALFGDASRLDYVFIDNIFAEPRSEGDWRRRGRNESPKDPEIATAWRKAFVEYFNLVKTSNPELKLLGNTDNDLSAPEYVGQLHGALLEALHGKDWSIETLRGWEAAQTRYHAVMRNTQAPHDVVYEAIGAQADQAAMRYGLASALMDDGWYIYRSANPVDPSWWFDEYDAPLGTPAEPPPTAAAFGAVWARRYTNGLVLVNPQKSAPATVTVPAGYRRIAGTQDPAVNDGKPVTSVTLPARSGLLLLKS